MNIATEFCSQLAECLVNRIQIEKTRRDEVCGKGSFASTALIEFLYRYWVEFELCNLGCHDIERERKYKKTKYSNKKRKSCDLYFVKDGVEYWMEIKVAYSDTGYTPQELTSDFDKLDTVFSGIKIYLVVFISEEESVPGLLKYVIEESKGRQAKASIRKFPISHTIWNNSHVHVACFEW